MLLSPRLVYRSFYVICHIVTSQGNPHFAVLWDILGKVKCCFPPNDRCAGSAFPKVVAFPKA